MSFAVFYIGMLVLPVFWFIFGFSGLIEHLKKDSKSPLVSRHIALYVVYLVAGIVVFLFFAMNVNMLIPI